MSDAEDRTAEESSPDPRPLRAWMEEMATFWRAGDPVPVETFLNREPAPTDREVVELAMAEALLRVERGESVDRAEYRARFPRLDAAILARFALEEALGARFDRGTSPSTESASDADPDATRSGWERIASTEQGSARPGEDSGFRYRGEDSFAPDESGRFDDLREHAKGGRGRVYRARDLQLDREVALKKILDEHADDEGARRRFLAEAQITGRLEHPGVVPVYALGVDVDGRPFYAMRFIHGDTLRNAARAFQDDPALKSDPGRRSLERRRLLRRFMDVCEAIEYAHGKGVIHRDIKPSNIILGRHGETLVVDWGLAKVKGMLDTAAEGGSESGSASGSTETRTGQILGTPAYMSAEQAQGDSDAANERTDVYSLGATLYELLCGRPPFRSKSVAEILADVVVGRYRPAREIDPTIDPALQSICRKAMRLDPAARYPSARALLLDVERWMADEPVEAHPDSLFRRSSRWARRHRALMTSVLFFLVGSVVVLSVATALIWEERQKTVEAKDLAEINYREAERQRVEAERQRVLAVSNAELAERRGAEAVVNFDLAWQMAIDVVEVVRLVETGVNVPPTTVETRRVLLDRVVRANEQLLRARPDDLEANLRMGRLLRYVANIARFLNETDTATRAYSKSIEVQGGLIDRLPDDLDARNERAETRRDLAALHRRLGRHAEAKRTIDAAVAETEPLAAKKPDRFRWPLAIASLERCESELRLGLARESEASAATAERLLDGELAPKPGHTPHHLAALFRADAETQRAKALREQGKLAEALASHDASVARFQTLLQANGSLDAIHLNAVALTERADTAVRSGLPDRRAQAAADLDAAILHWRRAAREEVGAPLYREWLSTALRMRGTLQADAAGRERDFAEALKGLTELAQQHPKLWKYRALLAEIWIEKARVATKPLDRLIGVDRALISLRWSRLLDPDSPKHSARLADVEAEWPQYAAALFQFRRVGGRP